MNAEEKTNIEELEKQLKELKEKLKEEKRKERIRKYSEIRKLRYKQKVFYVPVEIADNKELTEYYVLLKLAKKFGIKTFKKDKIYYVDEEFKKLKERNEKDNN